MNDNEYIAYRCRTCGFVFIIPVDGIRQAQVQGRFITCNLGHRGIEEIGRYDDLLECMQQSFSRLI